MNPVIPHEKVCALVLAGGRGSRMGGVDKGLQPFLGKPLVEHAMQRLRAQQGGAPGKIAINANRNLATYQAMGHATWPDSTQDFAGPLAGLQSALQHLQALPEGKGAWGYVLTVPCDCPRFPLDLLQRLGAGLSTQEADVAMAVGPELLPDGRSSMRAQPVFLLVKAQVQTSLQQYLASGQRKIDTWLQAQSVARVNFNLPHDDLQAFANMNTPADVQTLERL